MTDTAKRNRFVRDLRSLIAESLGEAGIDHGEMARCLLVALQEVVISSLDRIEP